MCKVSLIINTACLDPLVGANHNPHRKLDYSSRVDMIEQTLAYTMKEFDEVIVAGTFREGEGYAYVPVQPRYRDRRDALYQREIGARYATGDLLVFTHDDHAPKEGFAKVLKDNYAAADWDLIIPERRHAITDEVLNNGRAYNYMGGHTLVMKRWLWAEVPWTLLDTEWWDCSMTRIWREAGAELRWVDDLVSFDLEALEDEL